MLETMEKYGQTLTFDPLTRPNLLTHVPLPMTRDPMTHCQLAGGMAVVSLNIIDNMLETMEKYGQTLTLDTLTRPDLLTHDP